MVQAEFQDMEKDAINYGILTNAPPEVAGMLEEYFDSVVGNVEISSRDLRFALSKLAETRNPYAVPWLLANMGDIPHLARESLRYLHSFYLPGGMDDALVDLLTNSKLIIYPYAQHHLLNFMICHGINNDKARDAAWSILLDRNTETFVREFAARYVGKFADPGTGAALKAEFLRESNNRVRRALLVACYETGRCTPGWLASIQRSIKELRDVASYLRSDPKVIPNPWMEIRYE